MDYLRFILLLIKCTDTWSKWEDKLRQLYSSNVYGYLDDISNAGLLQRRVGAKQKTCKLKITSLSVPNSFTLLPVTSQT